MKQKNLVVVDELRGRHKWKTTCSGGKNVSNPANKYLQCTCCGHEKHASADKCPAQKGTCHKCKRKGNYSAMCFSKTVAPAAQEEVTMDDAYLDTVAATQENTWHITLLLEQTKVCLKMDIGAEVTAISYKVYNTSQCHQPLYSRLQTELSWALPFRS